MTAKNRFLSSFFIQSDDDIDKQKSAESQNKILLLFVSTGKDICVSKYSYKNAPGNHDFISTTTTAFSRGHCANMRDSTWVCGVQWLYRSTTGFSLLILWRELNFFLNNFSLNENLSKENQQGAIEKSLYNLRQEKKFFFFLFTEQLKHDLFTFLLVSIIDHAFFKKMNDLFF